MSVAAQVTRQLACLRGSALRLSGTAVALDVFQPAPLEPSAQAVICLRGAGSSGQAVTLHGQQHYATGDSVRAQLLSMQPGGPAE